MILKTNKCEIPENLSPLHICRGCECDDDCIIYGTCCIDKAFNTSTRAHNLQEAELPSKKGQTATKNLVCNPFLPVEDFFKKENTGYYFMISDCPNYASEEAKRDCVETSKLFSASNLPVFGFDKYLYKNAACAKCNDVKEYQYFSRITAISEFTKVDKQ